MRYKERNAMNQFRRMVIINIITLIVLVGGGIGGYFYYNQTENYLKTDNAKIDGKVIPVASPVAGKLTDWKAEVGRQGCFFIKLKSKRLGYLRLIHMGVIIIKT